MRLENEDRIRDLAAEIYGEEGTLFIPIDAKVTRVGRKGYWVDAVVWVGEDVVHGEQQTLPDA